MPTSNTSPRYEFTPVANGILRTTGNLADKGFRAFAKQNAAVTSYAEPDHRDYAAHQFQLRSDKATHSPFQVCAEVTPNL